MQINWTNLLVAFGFFGFAKDELSEHGQDGHFWRFRLLFGRTLLEALLEKVLHVLDVIGRRDLVLERLRSEELSFVAD